MLPHFDFKQNKKGKAEEVYLQQIKKKAKAEGKTCHAKTMLSLEQPINLPSLMKNTPHVPLRQIAEE
jgi:hypothetical protein